MTQDEIYYFVRDSKSMSFVRKEVQETTDRLLAARPEAAALLKAPARSAISSLCRDRLETLYMHAVASRILRNISDINPLAAVNLNEADAAAVARAERATARELGDDPAATLQETLPLLREHDERIRQNFLDSLAEFLDRFLQYRDRISEAFFGGRKIHSIDDLTHLTGDPHNHGRCVVGIVTDAGKCYYKPHDCSLDLLYRDLVELLIPDSAAAAEVISGNGFAFVSEIVPQPLESPAGAAVYYRNLGRLTALFHGIGSSDMHCENILPCGTKPAVIDLETLIGPKKQSASGKRDNRKKRRIYPVTRTSLLPHYYQAKGLVSPLYPTEKGETHLPYTGDARYSVEGHEAAYLEGFREGYERVAGHREEIRRLIAHSRDSSVRLVLRNTAYYNHFIRMMYEEQHLTSREAERKLLKRLDVPYRMNGVAPEPKVMEYEARCMLEGDVPYFCAALNGTSLCGASPKEVVQEDYLELSAMDNADVQLEGLNDADLRYETDLIRQSLKTVPLPDHGRADREAIPAETPETRRVKEALETICRELLDQRIRMADGAALWVSRIPSFRTLTNLCHRHLFSADVGQFVSRLIKAGILPESSPSWGEISTLCVANIRTIISDMERKPGEELQNTTACDAFLGLARCVAACDCMAETGVPGAEDAFRRLICLLDEKDFYFARDTDGLADLLTAICRSRAEEAAVLAQIRKIGERLLPIRDGAGPVNRRAARAAAMAAAFGRTGDPRFSAAAAEELSAISHAYSERIRGWPREEAPFPWITPRGTQAAWIFLCAADACAHLADDGEKDEAYRLMMLALGSLMDETHLWYNDSLHHGNALAVRALIRASELQEEPEFFRRAGQILTGMLDRMDRKGAFTVCPEGVRNFFDVSWSGGSLGIGGSLALWLAASSVDRYTIS